MKINVTVSSVIIDNDYIVNKGEYKVNPCEFTFSEEYTNDLVKKAIFVIGNTEIERAIINNKCDIPYDVLDSEVFKLCVYAYEVVENELVLRYSPTYAKVFLREGSYRGVTGSGEVITPTQYEQYEQALNDGLNEMNEKLAEVDTALDQVENVDIDAEKEGNTAIVIITNREGNQKQVEINDGLDYVITEEDYEEIADIVTEDLTPIIPTKTSDLNNDSGFIDNNVNDLVNYTLKSNTGSSIELTINNSTYVMTLKLKDTAGNTISTGTVDLPLESVVVSGAYDSTNKKVVLTLQNGSTIEFSVADLVAGLQSEITSSNKLSADLVDDTNSTNKFTNATEKSGWNAKYDKPNTGIPKTDLASAVQTSLEKADTSLQASDIVSSVSSSSTNSKAVGAKLFYDTIGDLETILNTLDVGGGVNG